MAVCSIQMSQDFEREKEKFWLGFIRRCPCDQVPDQCHGQWRRHFWLKFTAKLFLCPTKVDQSFDWICKHNNDWWASMKEEALMPVQVKEERNRPSIRSRKNESMSCQEICHTHSLVDRAWTATFSHCYYAHVYPHTYPSTFKLQDDGKRRGKKREACLATKGSVVKSVLHRAENY